MNHDERFQQRWEFRSGEVDGDTSSDDNGSRSSGDTANRDHKLVADLVLLENDEAGDASGCQRHDQLDAYNSVHSETVKAEDKKNESSKKKKVVRKKSEGCVVRETKRKRKLNANEVVMFKDLEMFADSLVHELTVARENMFAHMREEMKKLVASRSKLEPIMKNVRRSQKKKKVCPKNRIETSAEPQNCSGGSTRRNVESNVASDAPKFPKAVAEAVKHDQVLELTTRNELHKGDWLRISAMVHTNLANGSDQPVSSSHFPVPTFLPKPQFQNQRNHIHLNDHIPLGVPMNNSGPEIEIGKMMATKKFSHRIAEFQPEQRFGSFSHKSFGLLGQNSSLTTIQGIGFPIPLNQGTDNGSNMSSLTYCENSFMDNNGVGLRMNGNIAKFPRRSAVSSEQMIPDSIISKVPHKTDGEFVAARSQDLKDGQFYLTSLRNER